MFGMMRPNWFDGEFADTADQMTAEEFLRKIAATPRIVAAVKVAKAEAEEHRAKKIVGPSLIQMVRKAIIRELDAD